MYGSINVFKGHSIFQTNLFIDKAAYDLFRNYEQECSIFLQFFLTKDACRIKPDRQPDNR